MSTALVGIIIDKTKEYLIVIKVITWMCSFAFLCAIWVIPAGNIYLTIFLAAIIGIFMTPILPAGYSFSVHLTHPLPPAVSNGLMMTASQLFATLWSIMGAALLNYNLKVGIATFLAWNLTALLASCCIK